MSGFTEAALEKKLLELNNSQQSIQTLSLWLIHHRKHFKTIIQVWFRELRKAKVSRKLTFMHLANDIIQNSKKKGPEFTKEFLNVLKKAYQHVNQVRDPKTEHGLQRILSVWEDRDVYDHVHIQELRNVLLAAHKTEKGGEPGKATSGSGATKSSKRKHSKHQNKEKESKRKTRKQVYQDSPDIPMDFTHLEMDEPVRVITPVAVPASVNTVGQSPAGEPPHPEELIRSLHDLENAASSDATVRERIASLPPEVSDSSLLEKVQDREEAERLSRQVDEACSLLSDYNSRLSQELEDRTGLAKMLSDYLHDQRDQLTLCQAKLEEYKDKLRKVTQVRNELKSHLQNLPDLTLLPNVTGGLAPLPSAGDLFSQR